LKAASTFDGTQLTGNGGPFENFHVAISSILHTRRSSKSIGASSLIDSKAQQQSNRVDSMRSCQLFQSDDPGISAVPRVSIGSRESQSFSILLADHHDPGDFPQKRGRNQ
jgi:hypothetical protein